MPTWTNEEVAEMIKGDLDPKVRDMLAAAIGMKPSCPPLQLGRAVPVRGVSCPPTSINFPAYQTEAAHQVNVIRLLQENGWRVCEFRKARVMKAGVDTYRTPFGADGAGFPDLFAVRPPRAMLIEDKSDKGTAAPDQVTWLLLLGKCPQLEVYVIRPEDMARLEEIVK